MADTKQQFSNLTSMVYVDQVKWFLNGFWKDLESDAEKVWSITQKFIELDQKKKAGNELDEFWSHKFLESLGETLTVLQLREKLRKIDLDANGKMALLEYLAFRYNKTVQAIIDAPQGENSKEVQEAESKLNAAQVALEDVSTQHTAQQQAFQAQKAALEEQKIALEKLKKSEAELKSAVDDLKSQEDKYQEQIRTLEQKSKDASASMVSKSKAANELAQLKQEDPLPLRKAKITQEAALRKVEKERKAADQIAANLEAKTRELEAQTRKLEAAVRDAEAAAQEAADFLEQVKRKGGVPLGAIWWMERELREAQKYLPKKAQKI